MTEILEKLLALLCKNVQKSSRNAQQTVYHLHDGRDAKLAYDVLVSAGIDAKYFPENDGGKLYVQNASLASSEEKLGELMASAAMLKQIKNLLDTQNPGAYSLTYANTPHGRQLNILLPQVKNAVIQPSSAASAATSAAAASKASAPRTAAKKEEDSLAAGPAVARKAIPKSLKTSDSADEDPLIRRLFLYVSGRAFSSTAWILFFALILGLIFSILITIRGFLCPDYAGVQKVPSYCPKPVQSSSQ